MDNKYKDMLVHTIRRELYEAIKGDQSDIFAYSYTRQSRIDPALINSRFFKAEFTTWSAYELQPYCCLVEDLGPIMDEENYKKILLLNQGISEEMYPGDAQKQAKEIKERYEEILQE